MQKKKPSSFFKKKLKVKKWKLEFKIKHASKREC